MALKTKCFSKGIFTRFRLKHKHFNKNTLAKQAVFQRCSVKKVFLENSQNSQENTCARVSISLKLQASSLQLYQKETLAQAFSCEFCKASKSVKYKY